ncbi:MAG: hypothetical protein R3Y50_08785 [Rikenellaceae bacterium]
METFKVVNGKDKEVVKSYISKLPEGKRYEVIVKLHKEKRTLPQNSLFHLWCKCIQDDTGTDSEDVKRYCKERFLGYKDVYIFGNLSHELTSTAKLNTLQFTEFLNKMQAWAASELGIVLPIPEDLEFNHFYEKYKDR